MSDTVIRVENLSKRYQIGSSQGHFIYGSLRDSLANAAGATIRRLRGSPDSHKEENGYIWALKDVSFEVKQGEVLGIIGRNGAGKTTLLKILSRITKPTEGHVRLRGRVGSLLEVGTGFHPELTGRENIYLNGAVLGMKRAEINLKFDEIVNFSEIEQFLDTPVKHYSSGMYMRLAFSVAAHLEPEILLVDEVLAVGDTDFQKKCLGKMGEVAEGGRTVLFVSHNMLAMQSLCQRVTLLEDGKMIMDGDVHDIITFYLKSAATSTHTREWTELDDAPGNSAGRIKKIKIESENGNLPVIHTTESFSICVEYWLLQDNTRLGITLRLVNEQNIVIFATGTGLDSQFLRNQDTESGLYRSIVCIPANFMNSGNYHIDLLIVGAKEGNYEYPGIVSFEVSHSSSGMKPWYGRPAGVIHPIFEWQTEKL